MVMLSRRLTLTVLSIILVSSVVSCLPSDSRQQILNEQHQLVDEMWVPNCPISDSEDANDYNVYMNPSFPHHRLRVTEPSICDPSVQQYAGYFDISEGKHLFFWFFESRSSPEIDPLILWLNGGPGCSSAPGLLFTLGPCKLINAGHNVTKNPYSWTSKANVIFLDQPVNVGFSYSTDGSTINNSHAAAQDVYAFLQLFLLQFSKYRHAPFHVATESYGGMYGPNVVSVIYHKNKMTETKDGVIKINLASLVIANGLTNPYIQVGLLPEYICNGPYALYDDPNGPECRSLKLKATTCQALYRACDTLNLKIACVQASRHCSAAFIALDIARKFGKSPFDLRADCDEAEDKDGPSCYKEMGYTDVYMNQPEVKAALGINPSRTFQYYNERVSQDFANEGDPGHNAARLLTEPVNDGMRLLVYAGNADAVCHYMGIEAWLTEMDSSFQNEFLKAPTLTWINAVTRVVAGTVRSAGGAGSGSTVSFVVVNEAGHMTPFNQPENALDLITHWIENTPLVIANTSSL